MKKIELTRFRVLPNKSALVDEWMAYLNANLPAVLLTLEREKMYVETIFRETLNGEEFLYWYSIQGEDGLSVEHSDHEVDTVHLNYWKACIDPNFKGVDLTVEVSMIANSVKFD